MNKFSYDQFDFNGNPQRITLHWTGGSYTPSSLDAEHYHFLIDGDGVVWEGKYSVADQDSTKSSYAAHTSQFNTKNIGIAFCAMAGSKEGGTFGKYPITESQWETAIALCAFLCSGYSITPDKQHLASHCEIQSIHGVKQSGKWDVSAVTFMDETWYELNDVIRDDVAIRIDIGEDEDEPPRGDEITITVPRGTTVRIVEV